MKEVDVLVPNFKRRLSGVTSTIVRLVPIQSKSMNIRTCGMGLPKTFNSMPLLKILLMSRSGPSGVRVWHARRNVEMAFGLILKHLLGKKLALVFTSASQRHHTSFTKYLIQKMDFIVATSKKTASYLERDASVVMHGIDTDNFSPTKDKVSLRRELGLPVHGQIVGCFGRIRHQKGTDVFVKAMIDVLQKNSTAFGIIMGRATQKDSGFFDSLKDTVAASGLSDRILFLPEVQVWEIPDWYKSLDLYVAPQRWEGFGLTPLEAMSCGLPVVATKVGAFEELVVNGVTGQLIDADDLAHMSQSITSYLDHTNKIKEHGVSARNHVLQNFKIEHEADSLNTIYKTLLSSS